MKESISISATLNVNIRKIFEAWLNSKAHSEFTGGEAFIEPKPGGKYSAWDGMIFGDIIEIKENSKIVQSWRTTDFPEDAEDSTVELIFRGQGDSTELTITHSNIPEGYSEECRLNWYDFYLIPMTEYWYSNACVLV